MTKKQNWERKAKPLIVRIPHYHLYPREVNQPGLISILTKSPKKKLVEISSHAPREKKGKEMMANTRGQTRCKENATMKVSKGSTT